MQSFLLKTIYCTLSTIIINVTLCKSVCLSPVCKAYCYFIHDGYDYGSCENGENGTNCICSPSDIYVFDGIGRDLSEDCIANSLDNNKVIQSSVKYNSIPIGSLLEHGLRQQTVSDPSTDNDNYRIWNEIVKKITNNNPFIKEADLQNLKKKIIHNMPALINLSKFLQTPLENALNKMKMKEPDTFNECNDLLNLLSKLKMKKDTESEKSVNEDSKVKGKDSNYKSQNTKPPKVSIPQIIKFKNTVPEEVRPLPKENSSTKLLSNDKNNTNQMIDKNKSNILNKENKNSDLLVKPKVVKEEEKKHELPVEILNQTIEDNSKEHLNENKQEYVHPKKHQNIRNVPEKPQHSKTNKANNNLSLDEEEEYDESDSGSGSFYSSEEDEPQEGTSTIPKNK